VQSSTRRWRREFLQSLGFNCPRSMRSCVVNKIAFLGSTLPEYLRCGSCSGRWSRSRIFSARVPSHFLQHSIISPSFRRPYMGPNLFLLMPSKIKRNSSSFIAGCSSSNARAVSFISSSSWMVLVASTNLMSLPSSARNHARVRAGSSLSARRTLVPPYHAF